MKKQKIEISHSQNIEVIQAGRDVHIHKEDKKPSKRMEKLTPRYCQFIRDKYKTIPCLDENISLTMENYIPLQLGQEREEKPTKRELLESKELGEDVDFKVWREIHSSSERHSLVVVDIWKAIQNKKIVVKGDPGSGKTTLTHYIAYSLVTNKRERKIKQDLIPLLIDLKDWADKGDSLPGYYAKYALKNSGFEEEIESLIKDWLKKGRCIILCDGLDEVTQNRQSIIQALQNTSSGEYRNCPLLVTTRIAGYNNELSGWQHYEVMPLNKENISSYAEDYLKDESSFLSALEKTPQMIPLSKNPLLLQILCFVFNRQNLKLPAGRIELYKKAVHNLLNLREPKIPLSIKESVLEKIASYFLEKKEIFEEADLREIIKTFLMNKKEDYNADDVLKEIREKSGLLCSLGEGQYIFLHLTFQEYLAACWIVREKEEPALLLEPILFNPRFREVIRLIAGKLKEPKDFIEFILEQKPLYYDVFHQPLLLAGLCLSDIPEIDSSLEKKILDDLWELWKEPEFYPLYDEIERVFASLVGTKKADAIINNFLEALKDRNPLFVHFHAVKALGNLGHADDEVINALLEVLKDKDIDWYVRREAVKALGNLGHANEKVINAILEALKDKGGAWNVHSDAAEALGRLGCVDKKLINALLEALKDEDPDVRLHAAEALGRLGCVDKKLINAYLKELKDKKEWHVRSNAAKVLGRLGYVDEKVINALLKALKDEEGYVRENAAEALGRLGHADDKVINALLEVLKGKYKLVRLYAAKALGNLGRADDKVINALLEALEDERENVRGNVAQALGRLGHADDEVINALLKAIEDKHEFVRSNAAEALGNLGCADDKVINALLEALKDKDWYVRSNAAEALGNLGRADDKVINALLEALKDKDNNVKNSAYESLKKLVEKEPGESRIILPQEAISKDSILNLLTEIQQNIERYSAKELEYLPASCDYFGTFNRHGMSHSLKVKELMDEIVNPAPRPKGRGILNDVSIAPLHPRPEGRGITGCGVKDKNLLNEYEYFLLKAASYLHDIGLVPENGEDYKNKETAQKARKEHNRRSYEKIMKEWREIGLSDESMANQIAIICRAHPKKESLDELQDAQYTFAGNSYKVRLQLLAAILRLADALDADKDRIPPEYIRKNKKISKKDVEEYYKHEIVKDIKIEPNKKTIFLSIVRPNTSRAQEIEELLKASLEAELNSVKNILFKYNLYLENLKLDVTTDPYQKDI
ncbi:MAG: HEAT repeat domain-containing protein [bacterium]